MGLRFGGLGIFVKDLKTMVEFYGNLFSVSIEWDGNDPYAQFEHMGIRFMMYERKELVGYLGTEISYPNGINGTFELAIDLPEFADVDKEFEKVLLNGARPVVYPRNETWGMRTSFVLDPENNLIEIGSWGRGEIES